MKKEAVVKVKKVILHPGFIISKFDGDSHFITSSQLMQLYRVRDTDIVVGWDIRKSPSEEQQKKEGWINLEPRYKGDYYDIHKEDSYPDPIRTKL